MASVRLQGIRKDYEGNQIIKGIDLDIGDGEFVVLVGPSGCGKSTLLRMIAGLEEVSEGVLEIGGRRANDIAPSARGIAMVFQSYALYPHMTVAENMGFALKLAGVPKPEIATRVQRAAEILQIDALLARRPKALSGGQRQRVAIGRAIVRKPEVFLFDEPLSNLDAALRGQTRLELAALHSELKSTMIYVTHDQVEAMTLGQKIVVLNAGHIEQVGTPAQLYEHPNNRFVAGFLGSPRMNFLDATLVDADAGQATVRLASGALLDVQADAEAVAQGTALSVGVRPESLRISSDGPIDASVSLVEYLGDITIAYLHVAGVDGMVAVKCEDAPAARGAAVKLSVQPGRAHLFGPDGRALARPVANAPHTHKA